MTRTDYVALFPSLAAAMSHEETCLSIGRAFLSAPALLVLDGATPTSAYWEWLASQIAR